MAFEIISRGDKHERFAAWKCTCFGCNSTFKLDQRDIWYVHGDVNCIPRSECPVCRHSLMIFGGKDEWKLLPVDEWPIGRPAGWLPKGFPTT